MDMSQLACSTTALGQHVVARPFVAFAKHTSLSSAQLPQSFWQQAVMSRLMTPSWQ
jgi:hypothetical protein